MGTRPKVLFATGRLALGRNLSSNLVVMAVSLLINLWFTPFLISHLGEERYGFIPMATQLCSLLGLATAAFQLSAMRFLTIALEREDHERAAKVFNTMLTGCIAGGLLILFFGLGIVWSLDRLIETADVYLRQVQVLFGLSIGALVVTTFALPFSTLVQSRNRIDWQNIFVFSQRVGRVVLTVAAFNYWGDNLIYAGWAILIATLFEAAGMLWAWRHLAGSLEINFSKVNLRIFREMMSTGGWAMLSLFGSFLFFGVSLFLVNRFMGAELTSRYALMIQWAMMFQLLASSLLSVMHPSLVRLIAKENEAEVLAYLQRSMKFIGYTMAVCIGLFCGFSQPFLKLWIGVDFEDLWVAFWVGLLPMGVVFGASPLYSLTLASNHVRSPALFSLAVGGGNVCLIIFMIRVFDWGIGGVAACVSAMCLLQGFVLMPLYAAWLLKCNFIEVYRALLKVLIATGVSFGSALFVFRTVAIDQWWELTVCVALTLGFVGMLIYRFGLRAVDKRELLKLFKFKRLPEVSTAVKPS